MRNRSLLAEALSRGEYWETVFYSVTICVPTTMRLKNTRFSNAILPGISTITARHTRGIYEAKTDLISAVVERAKALRVGIFEQQV